MAKRKIHLTLGLESNLISCPESLLVTPRRSFFSVYLIYMTVMLSYFDSRLRHNRGII